VLLPVLLLLTYGVAVSAWETVGAQAHNGAEVQAQPLQKLQPLHTVVLRSKPANSGSSHSKQSQAAIHKSSAALCRVKQQQASCH
jgi:hypothetical protein